MASASRNSTPACAARPLATMTDIGVASPSAHGQAMISTATALSTAYVHEARARTTPQTTKVSIATAEHGQHEPDAHPIGEPLHRRARALRLRDQLHDLREHRVASRSCSARMTRLPVPFMVAPITRAPALFSTGIGSPVSIDSSTLERPSSTIAIDRHLLARAHAQAVADVHVRQRDVLLAAVGRDAARRLRAPAAAAP